MSRHDNSQGNAVVKRNIPILKADRVWQRSRTHHSKTRPNMAEYAIGSHGAAWIHSTPG